VLGDAVVVTLQDSNRASVSVNKRNRAGLTVHSTEPHASVICNALRRRRRQRKKNHSQKHRQNKYSYNVYEPTVRCTNPEPVCLASTLNNVAEGSTHCKTAPDHTCNEVPAIVDTLPRDRME
jgi:hypothetical protein